jgi:hypothetical protein
MTQSSAASKIALGRSSLAKPLLHAHAADVVSELPGDGGQRPAVLRVRRPRGPRQQLDHADHAVGGADGDGRRAGQAGASGDGGPRELGIRVERGDPERLGRVPDAAGKTHAARERQPRTHVAELVEATVAAAPGGTAAQDPLLLVRDPQDRDVPAAPAGQCGEDLVRRVLDRRRLGQESHDLRFPFPEPN